MSENELSGAAIGSLERAVGERKRIDRGRAVAGVPDPELVERPRRRRFTAEYKLRILREADACARPGEIGALLRRERGALEALERPRGRRRSDPRDVENEQLRRRAERAEAELVKARRVIEVQGNVSALLGELLEPRGAKQSTER